MNPFFFNTPVKDADFLGRTNVVLQIIDDLNSPKGDSYGIIGGKRCGKSSLLFEIESKLVKQLKEQDKLGLCIIPISISLQAIEQNCSLEAIFGYMIHRLRYCTHGAKNPQSLFDEPFVELGLPEYTMTTADNASLDLFELVVKEMVDVFYDRLGSKLRLVFLIDEVDTILNASWKDSLFAGLRFLITNSKVSYYIRFVLAGSGRYLDTNEQGSPLFNAIKTCFLEAFSDDDIQLLIKRAENISSDVATEIIREGGGHPFILQYILHYLIEKGLDNVTPQDVTAQVRQFIRDRNSDLSNWWASVGADGRELYLVLAHKKTWMSHSELRKEISGDIQIDHGLTVLCYHGIIVHDGTLNKFCTKGKLVEDWALTRFAKHSTESLQDIQVGHSRPIVVLFLAASPQDTPPLRISKEIRAINLALRQTKFRDKFKIEQEFAVQIADLQAHLLRHQPDIVHFSGHGNSSSEIILEDQSGNSQPVPVDALRRLFFVLKDNIKCVVLNACYSSDQAYAIAQHIGCVVGMSNAISDEAAISFSASFYQALGFGRTVRTAYELGVSQIDLENLNEHDKPQLLAIKTKAEELVFVTT